MFSAFLKSNKTNTIGALALLVGLTDQYLTINSGKPFNWREFGFFLLLGMLGFMSKDYNKSTPTVLTTGSGTVTVPEGSNLTVKTVTSAEAQIEQNNQIEASTHNFADSERLPDVTPMHYIEEKLPENMVLFNQSEAIAPEPAKPAEPAQDLETLVKKYGKKK